MSRCFGFSLLRLAAMFAVLLGCWSAGPISSWSDEPAESDGQVASRRVALVSYNIRYLNRSDGADIWEHRVDSVAAYLADKDVFALQEATYQQIEDLAERLPQFDWYGAGRNDGHRDGEATPIFWRKDRFTAVARDTFWLGPDPQAVGEPAWGANLPRVCSWVLLAPTAEHPAPAPRPFMLFNTHFDHQSSEAREKSAQLMLQQIAQVAESHPVVMTGDLNCRPDSKPIAVLTAKPASEGDLQLVDAITASQTAAQGPTGTWNGFKAINPEVRIDYILVRPGLGTVLEHITDDPKTKAGRFGSDHLPVRVIMEF